MRNWTTTLRAAPLIALLSIGGDGLAAAKAATVTWDLSADHGVLGTTQTYTAGGYAIVASGFTGGEPNPPSTAPTPYWTPTALYGKDSGGDERGLGINSDPSHDYEIWGSTFIEIDVSNPLAAGYKTYQFEMASSTKGEGWNVFGANDTPGPTAILHPIYIGYKDELVKHDLSGYKYYFFSYDGSINPGQADNVLIYNCPSGNTLNRWNHL
jgi:hypothetical protein